MDTHTSDRVTVLVVDIGDPTWHTPVERIRAFINGDECQSWPSWTAFLAADRIYGYTDALIVRVIEGIGKVAQS